jgi:hypothetical protein
MSVGHAMPCLLREIGEHAAAGLATPPDWTHAVKRSAAEQRQHEKYAQGNIYVSFASRETSAKEIQGVQLPSNTRIQGGLSRAREIARTGED